MKTHRDWPDNKKPTRLDHNHNIAETSPLNVEALRVHGRWSQVPGPALPLHSAVGSR